MRRGDIDTLFATATLAEGIDIPTVATVLLYDLPSQPVLGMQV
jgi:superfamily II DNA/RNA helicase